MEKWIISIAPSIFIIIGGIVTWFIKSRSEELQAIEKMLREKQREIYLDILDPYIHLFANLASGKNQNEVMKKIVSYEYRKKAFELNFFGSDEVVQAHNSILIISYNAEKTGVQDTKIMIKAWGMLLLEIRKSLGNKNTKLNELDMLHAMLKDADKIWNR